MIILGAAYGEMAELRLMTVSARINGGNVVTYRYIETSHDK